MLVYGREFQKEYSSCDKKIIKEMWPIKLKKYKSCDWKKW